MFSGLKNPDFLAQGAGITFQEKPPPGSRVLSRRRSVSREPCPRCLDTPPAFGGGHSATED